MRVDKISCLFSVLFCVIPPPHTHTHILRGVYRRDLNTQRIDQSDSLPMYYTIYYSIVDLIGLFKKFCKYEKDIKCIPFYLCFFQDLFFWNFSYRAAFYKWSLILCHFRYKAPLGINMWHNWEFRFLVILYSAVFQIKYQSGIKSNYG